MSKIINFEASIQTDTIEKLNDDFSKAECRVMYVDANRNGSFITKEAVEDAMPTIYNIPVVAEVLYKEDEKDFGTHGGRYIIDSNGIKFEQTTVPYGVVPESCNPRWEFVGDKEYLVCDVILWTGRYDDMEILLGDEEKTRPQSMEIHVVESYIDKDDYEQIEKLSFSALTILGANVEPCFEESRVKLYEQIEEESFKDILLDMREAYSKFCKEGGNDSVDNVEKKEFEENIEDVQIDSSSNLEDKTDESFVEEEKIETEKDEKFELSYKDKMQLLSKALPKDVYEERRYEESYVIDFTETKVDYKICIYDSGNYDQKIYRASYEISEEECTINFEGKEELFMELITKTEKEKIDSERAMFISTLNERIDELESKVEEFNKENENLKEELENEKQFRLDIEEEERKANIDEKIAEFANVLESTEEFEVIKENAYDMTCEDIEKECYILIGKMNFNKTAKKQKKEKVFSALTVEEKKVIDESNVMDEISKAYSKEM